MNLTYKVHGLDEIIDKFENFHRENPKAMSRAINSSVGVASTASLKEARKDWNIKAKDLKQYIKVDKARVNKMSSQITIKSPGINLHDFGGDTTSKGKKVTYKIQKKRKKLSGGFIQGNTAKKYILRREGKERYPIKPYFSISPTWMWHQSDGEKEFIKNFWFGKNGAGRTFEQVYYAHLKNLLNF